MKHRLSFLIIYALGALYICSLVLYVLSLDNAMKSENGVSTLSNPIRTIVNWQYRWGDSPVSDKKDFLWLTDNGDSSAWKNFIYPGKPQNPQKQRSIWAKTRLPEGEWQSPTLSFRAPQQVLEVYLDGKIIYRFGRIDFENTARTPGSIWHFIPLPEGFQGKTLYIRSYSPVTSYAGYLLDIQAGEKSSLILNILKKYTLTLILGSFFVFTGMVLILIVLVISNDDRTVFLSLGFSSIFLGLWLVAESKVLQLFLDIPVASVYVANISIFLMPIGFIAFVQLVFTEKDTYESLILKRLWQAFIALAAAAFLLDMLGAVSSLDLDFYLHVLIALTIIPLIIIIARAAIKGNRQALIFFAGLVMLSLAALYDIYTMFYAPSPLLGPHHLSQWGMLAMMVSLIIILGKRISLLHQQLRINSRENETNYRSLFKNMADGFIYSRILCDSEGNPSDCEILDTNPAFLENMGLGREEVVGRKISEILPELKRPGIRWNNPAFEEIAVLRDQPAGGQVNILEKWYKASAFSPKEGHMGIILSDITEMKIAETTIRRQAYTDSMTGFFNRTYFEDIMLRMGRLLEELKPLSFIVIDIDGLKITNDTFGHRVGDELLKAAGKIISEVFMSDGIITRVGGDEFCIILPHTDYETASSKRERIAQLVEKANSGNPLVPISMSAGVASFSGDTENEDIYNVYRQADDDMYQYKFSQSGSEKSKLIDMLLTALSERDYVSQGHVERLVLMSEHMAEAMGLHDIEKRNLILLAKVHDLGKIGITDKILFKSGSLTDEEYELMKQHVRIGYNIASRSKELVHIANLILHHHEHWNGKGYPDGLKGEDIPLECRVLSIIDAFDAMTSVRPYHKGISKLEALNEIKRCAGTQFDPVIAERFISIFGDPQ